MGDRYVRSTEDKVPSSANQASGYVPSTSEPAGYVKASSNSDSGSNSDDNSDSNNNRDNNSNSNNKSNINNDKDLQKVVRFLVDKKGTIVGHIDSNGSTTLFIDATNLYGYAIMQKLPYGGF